MAAWFTRSWADLPDELLPQIFSCLPTNKDKMQASLVCRNWQAEADASCQDISLPQALGHKLSDTQLEALEQWLPRRGTAVQTLALTLQPHQSIYPLRPPAALCSLQLRDGDSAAPWLPLVIDTVATSLTSLVLQPTFSYGSARHPPEHLLQQLRGLTSLCHLSIVFKGGAASVQYLDVLQTAAGLQHLTFLELRGGSRSPVDQHQAQQQCLEQLTRLKQLNYENTSLSGLEHLTALTGLSLGPSKNHFRLSVEAADNSSIGCLTNLRSLELKQCFLTTSAVSRLTALTALQLQDVTSSTSGMLVGFFAWLHRLPLLASLSVRRIYLGPLRVEVPPAAAWGALTASSLLQQLDLSGADPPRQAWLHIFPAGRQLLQLRSLRLPCIERSEQVKRADCMGPGEVQALVQCCPALVELAGGRVLTLEPALGALTALTRLCAVRGLRKAQGVVLESLTQLQEVHLCSSSGRNEWKGWDFQPLYGMQHLTRLELGIVHRQRLGDDAAYNLGTLVHLADLSGPILTESQLQRLTSLTNLTSLAFDLTEQGVLLVPRLQRVTVPSSLVHTGGHFCIQAPEGTAPSVASRLATCFVSDEELCQAANSKLEQLVQERRQLHSLVDELQQQLQNDLLQQQHQQVVVELQQCQQEKALMRQQLLQAQALQQNLQVQLDAATAANQALQAQLQPGMQLLQQGMQLLQGAMSVPIAPMHLQQLVQQPLVLVGQGSLPVQLQQQDSVASLLVQQPPFVVVGQGSLPVQLAQQGSGAYPAGLQGTTLQASEEQKPPADAALQDGLVDFDIERDIPEA